MKHKTTKKKKHLKSSGSWSVSSDVTFQTCTCKLHTTAERTRVWWLGTPGEHPMPWLLSMRTKNRKLHKRRPSNVNTIEWGPEFLPAFLAECNFERFHCDSRVKLSVWYTSLCSLRSCLNRTICALKWVCSFRKSTRNSRLQVAKGLSSDEGTHSLISETFYVRTIAHNEGFN